MTHLTKNPVDNDQTSWREFLDQNPDIDHSVKKFTREKPDVRYIQVLYAKNKIGFNNIKTANQNPIIKHLLVEDRLLNFSSLVNYWTKKKVFVNPLTNESIYYYARNG